MQADSDRSGTPPKQITGYIAEWLWFDEKCENADYFKEILKTLAEFWPPGAITHKSAVVNLHELIGTQACSNDSDTETEEEVALDCFESCITLIVIKNYTKNTSFNTKYEACVVPAPKTVC
ncbi:hypothetical protein Ddc_10775 [Ditylenchus destructor]|nr:hypothetical protein Ddc_10775 [Ditylenchus destructor]